MIKNILKGTDEVDQTTYAHDTTYRNRPEVPHILMLRLVAKSHVWGWNFVWGWNRLGVKFCRQLAKSQHRLNLAKLNIRGEILMSRHEDFDIDNGDASATKVWPDETSVACLFHQAKHRTRNSHCDP